MKKTPNPKQIREWLKNETTQALLERLALEMNKIDTIRNITPDNLNQHLAGRMAIEMIENWLGEIWELGQLKELQKELKTEEDQILKKFKELIPEY